MNYWIFQSKRYAPSKPLPYEIAWKATRYRGAMKPGELVYLWLSGKAKGVYGWGYLTSDPYDRNGTWAVDYKLEKWLTKPVLAGVIKPTKALGDLLILRMAVGTNFLIDRQEATAIAALIAQTERPKVQ